MIQRIKSKLYAFFFWQTSIGELLNKIYDLNIFLSNSFTNSKVKDKKSFEAFLTKQYHIIEKGMSLPKPRQNFGIPKIKVLIEKATEYKNEYGEDRIFNNIQDTLALYIDRNNTLKTINTEFYNLVINFINGKNFSQMGGVKTLIKKDIDNAIAINFENFIKTRSSVRDYDAKDVLASEVAEAIELAKYTPSVCNRQSWKVHYFDNDAKKTQLLTLQNGNNGFSEKINKLLIITTDTKKFTKLESNQVFGDGGMFAMSLVLALHAQGIASCCLNTCLPYVDEQKIKKIGNIPSSERLIMMIGIGNYKETFEVAISDRISVDEILVINR